MKKLELVADKNNIRESYKHIQVKNGYVYATNGQIAIKIPTFEVFGKDIITDSEELYFDASLWASSKMNVALTITRSGLIFHAYDTKGKQIGTVEAKEKIDGRFPDIDCIIPTGERVPLSLISFNPNSMLALCIAMGKNFGCLRYGLYGQTKVITVSSIESESIGIICQTITAINTLESEKLEAEKVLDFEL